LQKLIDRVVGEGVVQVIVVAISTDTSMELFLTAWSRTGGYYSRTVMVMDKVKVEY
jgi:hypothetical protein